MEREREKGWSHNTVIGENCGQLHWRKKLIRKVVWQILWWKLSNSIEKHGWQMLTNNKSLTYFYTPIFSIISTVIESKKDWNFSKNRKEKGNY